MRILIVNRHYGSDHVPTGRMLADAASALHDRGHEVTVLTARSSYTETADEAAAPGAAKVVYTLTFGEKHRLVSWVLFLVQAWARIPFMRWDRCLLLTDPPFLAAITILLRPWPRRLANVYWWTMDLYPEILVGSGRLAESSLLNRILRRINAAVIRRVGGVVLLGPCQVERMRRYGSWEDGRAILVPPWDLRPIVRVDRNANRFIEKYKLKTKKVALYAGNLGEGHTFAPLVEAARALTDAGREDWALVFVIRGAKKAPLVEAARDLHCVTVLDYQPVEWTSDLLWSADVHLITMNEGSKGLVVPSKLYGVLRTDAPVLFIGPEDADTALEIERYRAGEAIAGSSTGGEVVAALDRLHANALAGNTPHVPPDTAGPARIAEFVAP